MMKIEMQENRDDYGDLVRIIREAPERIEKEFAKGHNSWPACFGSSVFAVETFLSLSGVKNKLGQDGLKEAERKLEELKEDLAKLKKDYPETTVVPAEETRRDFIEKLNNIIK